ncbi:MAG: tetratricopeptide repeat protein [Sedimentisphaerales bacterium]|nr:tetratricopeptide repeat protein [Sedimentisphaerales bacterium]
MNHLLRLLGKGLEQPLTHWVLPYNPLLSEEDEKQLHSACKNHPEHIGNMMRLALHLAQSGLCEQAERYLQQCRSLRPESAEILLTHAAILASQGNLETAIKHLRQARRTDGSDPRICYALGHCLERTGEMDLAEEQYKACYNISGGLEAAQYRCAAIYLVRGQWRDVIEQCQCLSKRHPEDVLLHLILGQSYLARQDHEQARQSFERALTIEPDNFELHDDEIEELVQAGEIEAAVEELHQLIQIQGDFPDSYVRLGDLYSRLGEDHNATENYEQALRLHPDYLEAAVKLGTQHLRYSRFYDAATYFNRAMHINDRLISAYLGLARAEWGLEQSDQADDTFGLAAALEPNTNLLYAELSRLQRRLIQQRQQDSPPLIAVQDTDEPDKTLLQQLKRHEQACQKKKNDAGLHYRCALLLRGQGQTESALRHLRQAIEINPTYAMARMKLALVLREKGDMDAAWRELDASLQLITEQTQLHYKLALLYCDRIEYALAVEAFEHQCENADNVHTQANLDISLQSMGLMDSTVAIWRSLCELDPQSSLAFQSQRTSIWSKVHH